MHDSSYKSTQTLEIACFGHAYSAFTDSSDNVTARSPRGGELDVAKCARLSAAGPSAAPPNVGRSGEWAKP